MVSRIGSPILISWRPLLLAAALVAAPCRSGVSQAAQPPAPQDAQKEPDAAYREEYKLYQAITAETDPAKKVDMVITFLKDHPKSQLVAHATNVYLQVMNDYNSGQKYPEIIATGEKYLALAPDDTTTITLLTEAYQRTGKLQQFADFGVKVYAKTPTPNLAYYLARAYLDTKNEPKFIEWAEKAVAALPDKHDLLLELAKRHGGARKNAAAAKYARGYIKAVQAATKPEGVPDATWNQYKTTGLAECYIIVGNVSFEAGDFPSTITNLEASLKYYPKNEIAFYRLGQSYWQTGKVDLAMKNFAKAYLMKGKTAAAGKQQLDNLYKSTHGNSLAGLERVIEKARSELQ